MSVPLPDGWNTNVLHRGKQTKEFSDHPPLMQLNYKYTLPFNAIAKAYLTKYNWEARTQLHSIAHVDQPDDDTIVYWRRSDRFTTPVQAWERVTVNRKDQTMRSEMLQLNTDGTEAILDAHKYWAEGANTHQQMSVFQGMAKSYKVEQFKFGIS